MMKNIKKGKNEAGEVVRMELCLGGPFRPQERH